MDCRCEMKCMGRRLKLAIVCLHAMVMRERDLGCWFIWRENEMVERLGWMRVE